MSAHPAATSEQNKKWKKNNFVYFSALGGKWKPWIHLCCSINLKKIWFIFSMFSYSRHDVAEAERLHTMLMCRRWRAFVTLHIFYKFIHSHFFLATFWHRRSSQRRIANSPGAAFMQQLSNCAAHIYSLRNACAMWMNEKLFQSFSFLFCHHRLPPSLENGWIF